VYMLGSQYDLLDFMYFFNVNKLGPQRVHNIC